MAWGVIKQVSLYLPEYHSTIDMLYRETWHSKAFR